MRSMNKLFKDFMNSGGRQEVDLDAAFSFQCTSCGDCCKTNATVVLNGFDFLRLAEHLHMSNEDVFREYIELTHLETSNFPLMVIKPLSFGTSCRFNRDGRCSIYKARPFICRLFPVGYTLADDRLSYFKMNGCPRCSTGGPITLSEYIKSTVTPDELERQRSFLELTYRVFAIENLISDKVAVEDLQVLYGEVFAFTYLDYESSKHYDKAFKKNAEKILWSLNYVAQHCQLPDHMRD